MGSIIVYLLITSALILVIEHVVKGIDVDDWKAALFAAAAIGIINTLIRPIAVFLTLPLTILTLGLFLLVVNALMFKLAAAVVPGFRIQGFLPAIYGSVLLTLMNLVVGVIL